MNDIKKIAHHLDYLFLKKIIAQLKDKSITEDQARLKAREFRALGSFASIEDCQAKIKQFTAQHPEHADMTEYADAYYKEKDTHKLVAQMKKHLKNNDIDSALKIAQN